MTRMIDAVLGSKAFRQSVNTEHGPSIDEALCSAEVLVIDNVASYYHERCMNSSSNFQWSFPNVAPPFENYFVEFYMPGYSKRLMHGVHINAFDTEFLWNDEVCGTDEEREVFVNTWSNILPTFKRSKWMIRCMLYKLIDNKAYALPSSCFFSVDSSGAFVSDGNVFYWRARDQKNILDFAEIQKRLFFWLYPVFLATSFLHCKNVTMQKKKIPAPLFKKHEKKHNRPLVSYHTLNIEPMKQVLRTEGNIEKTGLKQALHICRGHFKDFSKGNGLFGKFKGLYWWDSQVRGSVSEGIVDKDYAVKSPKVS